MANRVVLDQNFVVLVEREASGTSRGTLRAPRRRRTTLQDIADDIVETAVRLTDAEARPARLISSPPVKGIQSNRGGLPHVGRKRVNSPFRRSDEKGRPTYRTSFRADVDRREGKLVVEAANLHHHAGDVEFGTARTGSRKAAGQFVSVKLSERAYKKLQRSRNLSRADRKKRGWESASDAYKEQRNKRQKQLRKTRSDTAGRGVKITTSRGRKSKRGYPREVAPGDYRWNTFAGVKAYRSYGILRRAMRIAADRKLG